MRPVHAQSGIQSSGAIAGNWVNVADRYGMAARGHLDFFLQDVADTRGDAEDQITNPHRRIHASGDATNRNRGALILPNATAQATALASLNVDFFSINSWSALSARAPDGTGRVAVARWGGTSPATITLTSPLGAPIPDRPNDVTVSGNSGTSSFSANALTLTGHKAHFWVNSTSSLTALPISETLVRITNGASSSTVTTRYATGYSPLAVAQRSLSANQVALAKAMDDGVTLTLPSATTQTAGHEPFRAFDGSTSSSSYWQLTAQNPTTSPQELRLDFGRPVNIGGLTQTPLANLGPRDYFIEVSNTGVAYSLLATVTNASATSSTTTTFAFPTRTRFLRIRITRAHGAGPLFSVGVRELAVNPPTLDLDATSPVLGTASNSEMRLARGGFAQATYRLTNRGATAVNVTLTATVPPPMTATWSSASTLTVPAGGAAFAILNVRGTGATPTTGSSVLTVTGSGFIDEPITLLHTDNLALNDTGGAFPGALASSEDPAYVYPARLANDGNTSGSSNFWVSGPAVLASDPQCISIDSRNFDQRRPRRDDSADQLRTEGLQGPNVQHEHELPRRNGMGHARHSGRGERGHHHLPIFARVRALRATPRHEHPRGQQSSATPPDAGARASSLSAIATGSLTVSGAALPSR